MSVIKLMRVKKEIEMLNDSPPFGLINVEVRDASKTSLVLQLRGPSGSPYEKGVFFVSLDFPEKFPFEPPVVLFITRIYHPNIDLGGRICMELLKSPPTGGWRPSVSLGSLIASLLLLLSEPNPSDPLEVDIAKELLKTPRIFERKAREFTEEFAIRRSETKAESSDGPEATKENDGPSDCKKRLIESLPSQEEGEESTL